MNVVQLYLPQPTLERISGEADRVAPGDLPERTAHPDPTTSRLLMSAADFLDGREPLDALFAIVQGIVLVFFVVVIIGVIRRYRPTPTYKVVALVAA